MTIKGKITSLSFDVTKNKTLMLRIKLDTGSVDGYILYNNLYYAMMLKEGNPVEICPATKSIILPEKHKESLNEDNIYTKMFNRMYSCFVKTLCDNKFGESTEIADFEVKQMAVDYIDEETFAKDCVLEALKNSKSEYAKRIISEMGVKKTSQTVNPYDELDKTAGRFISKQLKGYKIVKTQNEGN